MAVRNSSVLSLVDVTRTMNPDGTQGDIAEVLTESNDVLKEMTWKEGNLVTGERTIIRDSLPGVGWRRLNEGVPVSKSTSRPFDEAAALLEANSQIDRKVAILGGNVAKVRASEASAFMEAMNQEMAETLFFGNSQLYATEFTGLAPRFNTLADTQVINAGGVGTDNRSIWLVGWGEETVSGIFPKGTVGGLIHWDGTSNTAMAPDGYPIGDRILDASGNPYYGYADHYEWNCGLMVKDRRFVVRIANIDQSLLTKDVSTGGDLQDLMVQALERIQRITANTAFYTSRTNMSFLRRQLLNAKNAYLSMQEIAGEQVLTFGGVPVRRTDALNIDEAAVV